MEQLSFKVHIPNLLEEIVTCAMPKTQGILFQPINQFKRILCEISERCIELNDPVLNKLMFENALYEGAEPSHKDFKQLNKKVQSEYKKYLNSKKSK